MRNLKKFRYEAKKLLATLKSDNYKRWCDTSYASSTDTVKQNQEGKVTRSVFNTAKLYQVSFYDTMDNHALNKLLRKIHTLEKSKKVKVDTVFRKPPKLFDFTYIKQNDFSSHIAVIARLTFMADKYVDSINIYCSQPSSIFTFVEFELKLKNSFFTNNDVEIFLNSGIDHVTKDDYFNYIDSHSLKEQLYYSMIQQFAYDLLNLCLQRYITHFCYSKNGKKGFLYSLSSYCQPEEVVLEKNNFNIACYSNFIINDTFYYKSGNR